MLWAVIAQIEQHDRDLARRLKRCATSIALNTGEGSGCSGGTRRERHKSALASAKQTGCCLDSTLALGDVEQFDPVLLDKLDKIRATLAKNVSQASGAGDARAGAGAPTATPTR